MLRLHGSRPGGRTGGLDLALVRWLVDFQLVLQMAHQIIHISGLLAEAELPGALLVGRARDFHRSPVVEKQPCDTEQQAQHGAPHAQPGMGAAQPFQNGWPMPASGYK